MRRIPAITLTTVLPIVLLRSPEDCGGVVAVGILASKEDEMGIVVLDGGVSDVVEVPGTSALEVIEDDRSEAEGAIVVAPEVVDAPTIAYVVRMLGAGALKVSPVPFEHHLGEFISGAPQHSYEAAVAL